MNAIMSFQLPDATLIWTINVLLQVTLVAGMALILARGLRRAASLRFGVLCAALGLILLSPLLATLLQKTDQGAFALRAVEPQSKPAPTQDVDNKHEQAITSNAISHATASSMAPTRADRDLAADQSTLSGEELRFAPIPNGGFGHLPVADATSPTERVLDPSDSATPRPEPEESSTPTSRPTDRGESSLSLLGWLHVVFIPVVLIWSAGTLWFVLRLTTGMLRVRIVLTSSRDMESTKLSEAADLAQKLLRLNRRPRIQESPNISSPIAVGLWRSRVILPQGITERVSPEQLRDILIHEFAHVLRRDQLIVIGQLIAEALFWFHPLVRSLNRQLAQAREEVCDNHVLNATDAPSYSRTLLTLAELIQHERTLPGTVGLLTAHWQLESRVRGLLDARRNSKTRLTKRGQIAVVSSAMVLLLLTGAGTVRLVGHSSESAPAIVSNERSADNERPSDPAVLHGSVTKPDGTPAAGARVIAIAVSSKNYMGNPKIKILQELTADEDGSFEFNPLELPDALDRGIVQDLRQYTTVRLVATLEGLGPALAAASDNPDGEPLTMTLAKPKAVQGQLIDLDGQPLAGVQLHPLIVYESNKPLDEWFANAAKNRVRDERSMIRANPSNETYEPIEHPFPRGLDVALSGLDVLESVETDGQGNFSLPNVGPDRLLIALVDHPKLATTRVNLVSHDGPSVFGVNPDPRIRDGMIHGNNATIAVESGQALFGSIRDASTGEPIPDCRVSVTQVAGSLMSVQDYAETWSKEDGSYRLTRLPPESDGSRGYRIEVTPPADQPYFPTDLQVHLRGDEDSTEFDIELKESRWVKGRVVDSETGEPVRALVGFLPSLENDLASEYANYIPGMRTVAYDDFRLNEPDGSFRVPAIDGKGALCVTAELMAHYRLASNGASIGEWTNEEDGINVYHVIAAEMMNHIRRMDISSDEDDPVVEIKLTSLSRQPLSLVDENAEPVTNCQIIGLLPDYSMAARQHISNYRSLPVSQVDVLGLEVESPRVVAALCKARNLAGFVVLNHEQTDADQTAELTLHEVGQITGRVVDGEGRPQSGVRVRAMCVSPVEDEPTEGWYRAPQFRYYAGVSITDDQGIFEIDHGVIPGLDLQLTVGLTNNKIPVKALRPGERRVLGDINTESFPTEAGGDVVDSVAFASVESPTQDKPESVTRFLGSVVDEDRDPVSGAMLAVTAISMATSPGGQFNSRFRVLHEAVTDEAGRYDFRVEDITPESYAMVFLAVRSKTSGLKWQQINPNESMQKFDFALTPELPVRGRLINIEGLPAANVTMHIESIMLNSAEPFPQNGISLQRLRDRPAVWPNSIVTNDEGEFTVHGVGAGHGIYLNVEGNEEFAIQDVALNTGMPETRGERDATYRPIVQNLEPDEEAVIVLSPATRFEGVIRYEDTNEPAPHARLTIWASQQDFGGSMVSIDGMADEKGQYAVTPYPGVRFGLQAFPPPNTPYMIRRFDEIRDNEGDRPNEIDLALPRGVLVRGQVVDEDSGQPIVGAAIQYLPQSLNNEFTRDDVVTGWQGIQVSDENGEFSIAVFPGPGTLAVHGPDNRYVVRQVGSRMISRGGTGGQRYYSHHFESLDLEPDTETFDVQIALKVGRTISGNVTDEKGEPVAKAQMISAMHTHPLSLTWRSTGMPIEAIDGRFEIKGIGDANTYSVYFIDHDQQLGGTLHFDSEQDSHDIQLKRLGSAKLRVLDQHGDPREGYDPTLYMVVTPGADRREIRAMDDGEYAADADFIQNIDRVNHRERHLTDANGDVTIGSLIPGATYRLIGFENGGLVVTKEFVAKSGESMDLGKLTFPQE